MTWGWFLVGGVIGGVIGFRVGSRRGARALLGIREKAEGIALEPCRRQSSASPTGGEPLPGRQSRLDYEWCVTVKAGMSAGAIARAVTGDDGRYQDLILANPGYPRVGKPGVYVGPEALQFAALKEGNVLAVPMPWRRYADQYGRTSGLPVPWPKDARVLKAAPSAPALDEGDDDEAEEDEEEAA
jgi:hypothetical protein